MVGRGAVSGRGAAGSALRDASGTYLEFSNLPEDDEPTLREYCAWDKLAKMRSPDKAIVMKRAMMPSFFQDHRSLF